MGRLESRWAYIPVRPISGIVYSFGNGWAYIRGGGLKGGIFTVYAFDRILKYMYLTSDVCQSLSRLNLFSW